MTNGIPTATMINRTTGKRGAAGVREPSRRRCPPPRGLAGPPLTFAQLSSSARSQSPMLLKDVLEIGGFRGGSQDPCARPGFFFPGHHRILFLDVIASRS